MNIRLSKNFLLEELLVTQVGVENFPTNLLILNNLYTLTNNVLQPLRDLVGVSINVNSGFRSPEVNKLVGGASNSQHLEGKAADISCSHYNSRQLFDLVKQHLPFDQLILYPTFIHVSYNSAGKNRGQVIDK